MIRVRGLRLEPGETEALLRRRAAARLRLPGGKSRGCGS